MVKCTYVKRCRDESERHKNRMTSLSHCVYFRVCVCFSSLLLLVSVIGKPKKNQKGEFLTVLCEVSEEELDGIHICMDTYNKV